MKTMNIFSQLTRQLSISRGRVSGHADLLLKRRPRLIYCLMLLLLAGSALLCFTLLRSGPLKNRQSAHIPDMAAGRIGGAYHAAGQLSDVLKMQAELGAMMAETGPGASDSTRMAEMMEKIKKLQLNIKNHEKNQP